MNIEPFELERWFAEYEHEAEIMLAESGIRSLDASRFELDPGELGYIIPTNGDPKLRGDIGKRYGRGKEEVLLTCGTQEANFLAFVSLLSEGSHSITVTPTYQALHSVPEAFGKNTKVSLRPPNWELDVDKVKKEIREDTELIVLNNPNNPTGRYHPLNKVEELYEVCEKHDIYLLCDEVYRLLSRDPLPPVASMGEYGLSTTSLTKSYGLAGTRLGWLVGSKDVIEDAWQWKDYTTISPSILGQHVAKQALGEKENEILEDNRALAERNRKIVSEFIDEHGLSWYDPVGVNGFVTVPDKFDGSENFCRALVEQKSVVLAPGKVFGFDGFFRIGFGLETEILKEGLERVSEFINGY